MTPEWLRGGCHRNVTDRPSPRPFVMRRSSHEKPNTRYRQLACPTRHAPDGSRISRVLGCRLPDCLLATPAHPPEPPASPGRFTVCFRWQSRTPPRPCPSRIRTAAQRPRTTRALEPDPARSSARRGLRSSRSTARTSSTRRDGRGSATWSTSPWCRATASPLAQRSMWSRFCPRPASRRYQRSWDLYRAPANPNRSRPQCLPWDSLGAVLLH